MGRCSNREGACSELIAAVWLLEQGFEVFRNVSPDGPADLVAWKRGTDEKFLIDVKTSNKPFSRSDGFVIPNVPAPHPDGVHYLIVHNSQVFGFFRRGENRGGAYQYFPFCEED